MAELYGQPECCPDFMPDPDPTFLAQPLQPGDYYLTPEGFVVFTEQYHRRRGSCCGNGCRHCPWRKEKPTGFREEK